VRLEFTGNIIMVRVGTLICHKLGGNKDADPETQRRMKKLI